ncbi:MAG: ABC transporter permease [Chloroflexi bacterium]|nr:ABC transporter permease [Chloroflexota bacterium]
MDIVTLIAAVVAASPPIIFAVMGETITEKAGVINLSLDGSILISAMAGFVVALKTGSVALGFGAGMAVGAAVALLIAFISLTLKQPQVATGFVLTLLCRDLAYVLGNPYAHVPGPQVPHTPIPGLVSLPVVGPILFNQNPVVYLSILAIVLTWAYVYKTQPGLKLQGLGEKPAATFVRGVNVTRMRYVYTAVGGALVGFGGAAFSLLVKPGWARPYGIEGTGWIALAIVIFGNWQPVRAAVGAYLFVLLQMLANTLQSALPNVPTQVFPTLPFPLMILTLVLVTLGNAEWVNRALNRLPKRVRQALVRTLKALQTVPPASLGTAFNKE